MDRRDTPQGDRARRVGVPSGRVRPIRCSRTRRRRTGPPRFRRPARRPQRARPDAHHQPPGASQRHDLGRHRRTASGAGPGQGGPRRAGGGPDRGGGPGVLRRSRPLGHGAEGSRGHVGRVPRPPPGPGLAGPAVRGDVAARQAHRRPGPGLGHGRRVRPRPGVRHGDRLGERPLRRPRAQRGAVALHGDRLAAALHAPEEGPGADADQPGRGGRGGRPHRVRDPGGARTPSSTPPWPTWPRCWPPSPPG